MSIEYTIYSPASSIESQGCLCKFCRHLYLLNDPHLCHDSLRIPQMLLYILLMHLSKLQIRITCVAHMFDFIAVAVAPVGETTHG